MAENTKVEWATHSWNSWIGCQHVHIGCQNCFAEAQSGRHGVTWGPEGTRRKTSEAYWRKPIAWNRRAGQSGERPRVFSSLCDPFELWQGPILDAKRQRLWNNEDVPRYLTMNDVRRDFFRLIDRTPNLDWLLLTKRPGNVRAMLAEWLQDRCGSESPAMATLPVPNLWLGVSVSDQETADELIPELLKLRELTPRLFVSCEPLLGPIDLTQWFTLPTGNFRTCRGARQIQLELAPRLDWLVVGGESGPRARPCDIKWVRSIVEQCKAAGVACFVKQLGSNVEASDVIDAADFFPGPVRLSPGKRPNARAHLLDRKGGNPAEWPEDLRIRHLSSVPID